MDLIEKIISVAKSYIGQEETKGNSGFKSSWFQTIMAKMGWQKYQSWCAYSAKAVWYNAFLECDPIGAKLILKYANGSAVGTYNNFAKSKEFHVQKEPALGALVIFSEGSGPFGHEGVVTRLGKGKFSFASGNTTKAGSREGTIFLEKDQLLNKSFNPHGLNIVGFVNPKRIA